MVRWSAPHYYADYYAAFVVARTGTTSKWFATNARPNPSLGEPPVGVDATRFERAAETLMTCYASNQPLRIAPRRSDSPIWLRGELRPADLAPRPTPPHSP
jgi:hypothetical protein